MTLIAGFVLGPSTMMTVLMSNAPIVGCHSMSRFANLGEKIKEVVSDSIRFEKRQLKAGIAALR